MASYTISDFASAKLAIMMYQSILKEAAEVLRKNTRAEICGKEYHPEWVRDLLLKIEAVGG
jgi:hypothetical protein